MFDTKPVTFSEVVDAEALGRKFGETYDTQDAQKAAEFCLIPEVYSERLRLRIAVLRGMKSVRNDNFNYHLLLVIFEQELRDLAKINNIRDIY